MGSSIAWFSTLVRKTARSARVSRLSVSYDYDDTKLFRLLQLEKFICTERTEMC